MILEFYSKSEFKVWLENNHDTSPGVDIYIYKKKYHHLGLSYEDAVQTALCYGWIDAVTHSHDDVKFIQYFARRKKNSHWSLSNLNRMKHLIDSNQMTAAGLTYFDMDVLKNLNQMNADNEIIKTGTIVIPDFFRQILITDNMLQKFEHQTKGVQNRYIEYIQDAKKETTRIRRCYKIIDILNGEKNNL